MPPVTRFQPESPFTPLTRLPDMIDQLFRESFVMPRFDRLFEAGRYSNLMEINDSLVVQLLLPGVNVETIHIEVVGQQLTVKATFDIPTFPDAKYIWNGLKAGEFAEIFTLPMEVTGEKAKATYDLGILTITLPKTEYAKAKVISVDVTH